MTPEPDPSAVIKFGRFAIRPLRREVLADGRPVALGGRAFDTLMVLVDARGTVLSKDELMRRVWPDRVVEENNLDTQISTLRKVFGADRYLIRTVTGRGYQFTGEIHTTAAEAATATRSRLTNLPEPVSEFIGREGELSEISDLVLAHRLITLTGAGGIGKTRLALEVARQLLPRFADGVWVVELAPLSDPNLLPATVATAVGIELAAVSTERVAAALGTTQVLLLLDNSEHLIEAAARIVEALLRAGPAPRVLVTSREPLRAENEYLYRVPPLAVPAEGNRDVEDVLRHGAVKLFVSRALAADPRYAPDTRLAETVAAICRHLDGIPLAIELAASHVAAFGVEGIAARLDDRFRLLKGGHRTALPRHQTLRATLDWSYELLDESERVVFRRLGLFAGAFPLDAASEVAADSTMSASEVVDGIANLVAKSLLTASLSGGSPQYRLLETTRAYALEKLSASGELHAFSRRHAAYFRDVFETARGEWDTRPSSDWLVFYGHHLDNVRAALDWAFSPHGDAEIGVALTVAAVPLWLHLSLIAECGARAHQALSRRAHGAERATRRDMELFAAVAASLLYTKAPDEEINAAWTRTLEIAESLGDADYRLRGLWGLWAYRVNSGEYRAALTLAQAFSTVAASKADRADALIGDRLVGLCLHFLGDQPGARRHLERMLSLYVAPSQRSDLIRFQTDQRVMAKSTLAHALWLQGFPDQAMRTAETAVKDAQALDHVISLCNALGHAACPIALLNGDLFTAERFVGMLLMSSEHRILAHLWGRCFEGALLVKRGTVGGGLQRLTSGLDELRERRLVGLPFNAFLADLADGLGRAGDPAGGLVVIDEALERSERNDERWCMAELLRVKGELLRLEGAANGITASEGCFLQALGWAREQGALSWELRCATSLARAWHEQGRTNEASVMLARVYEAFTEGFGTADLIAAKALLDTVRKRWAVSPGRRKVPLKAKSRAPQETKRHHR
jgi:predicted ATPase/DNA-binding winged helix-turn-helix (wHTH) protein